MFELFRKLEFHFFFGLKSNIPICCVLFFLFKEIFKEIFYDKKCRSSCGFWIAFVQYNIARITGIKRSYSTCPICLITGHKQELKICGPDFKNRY